MTTYYDEHYNAFDESDMLTKFYEWLDEQYPTVTIYEAVFYPSNIIGNPGDIDHDEIYNNWLNDMQDAGIYTEEGQLTDIDMFLDEWLHGEGWTDTWHDVDSIDLLYAAQHMHSTGRIELVNGEIQPHPDYSISDIQSLINVELHGKDNS